MTASLVLQTSFLGDMILTTPLITRLAEEGPVHVVATPANAGILAHHPAVSSVLVYDKRGVDRGLGGLRRIASRVRELGASRAFLAQGSIRTAAVPWLARIRERVGFDTSPGRVLYTRQVTFDRRLHHAQRLWQLAGDATPSGSVPVVRPSLHPGEADRTQWAALRAEFGVDDHERLITLAPGSVWATKRWPSFPALAAALAADTTLSRHRLVVIGGGGDTPLATAVSDAVRAVGGPRVVDATGMLSLLASAIAIGDSDLLVTNDSSPLHLASAMNTPTVALFGPTVPRFGFGPLSAHHAIVEHTSLACRPCHAHGKMTCPLGHWRCMQELPPAQVAEHVQALLSLRS